MLNFAARVISGRRKYDRVSDVLRGLEWLTAHNLHVFHTLTLVKRILTADQPETFSASLVQRRNVHRRVTRQNELLDLPTIRSESGRRRFLYSAVTAFNGLPQHIRDLNPRLFKRELRSYILQQQATVSSAGSWRPVCGIVCLDECLWVSKWPKDLLCILTLTLE